MCVTDEKLTADLIIKRRRVWCNELVSRKYTQGQTYLKTLPSDSQKSLYCCLGVACEVFGSELSVTEKINSLDKCFVFEHEKSGDWRETYLPRVVRQYLGLSHNSERILAIANDNHLNFETIASMIDLLPVDIDG